MVVLILFWSYRTNIFTTYQQSFANKKNLIDIQWVPLNVITDNVIIWLMVSHLRRPNDMI
jgi:hypothetical protein